MNEPRFLSISIMLLLGVHKTLHNVLIHSVIIGKQFLQKTSLRPKMEALDAHAMGPNPKPRGL